MITKLDANNKAQIEMYEHLFSKAWKDLEPTNKLTDEERSAGMFTSLDQYFAHMADLVELKPVYMMLPLDESTEGIFTINANDRTITIPAQFNKCAGVQNDEFCEIAVFTVDRYFDFQDLNETNICIQWINAAGEEGISHICCFKDSETYPGKLRFGWPLTSKITKKAGPVQFAVRFYINKEVEQEDGSVKRVDYILNTLQHSITIKPTLDVNPVHENIEQIGGDIFKTFVKNSQNPTFKIPLTPLFIAPGEDLPQHASINTVNDSLTLRAQAVANDMGAITYKWKYKNAEANINDLPVDLSDSKYSEIYTIEEIYEQVKEDDELETIHKYYTYNEGKYEPCLDKDAVDKTSLYLRYTQLTVIPNTGKDVVGSYHVEAINTTTHPNQIRKTYILTRFNETTFNESLSNGEEIYTLDGYNQYVLAEEFNVAEKYYTVIKENKPFNNSTNPVSSSTCIVLAPEDIEISKDLPNHMFISENVSSNLTIGIKEDSGKPTYSYKWFNSNESESSLNQIDNVNSAILEAKEPGWYKVKINSLLNRKEKETESTICKVTYQPKQPTNVKYYYAFTTNVDKDIIRDFIENSKNDNDYEVDGLKWKECQNDNIADVDGISGTIVLMKIETNLDKASSLETEGLTYKWKLQNVQKATDETSWRELTVDDQDESNDTAILVGGFDLNSNVLVARILGDRTELNPYNYACEIINTINGVSTEAFDTATHYTFTII